MSRLFRDRVRLLPGRAALTAVPLALLVFLAPPVRAAEEPAAGRTAFRAFDDDLFTVAYDVFLAARNVKDAHLLAKEAVRQRPDLPAWRERLARTAEWAGDPRLALQEWEHLYARVGRPEAYREAIRLAGILRDHAAAVRAWEALAAVRELDGTEWGRLLEEYEDSGEPGRGIERLRKRLAARPDRVLEGKLVDVLLRSGRDGEALEALDAMASRYGASASLGLRRAEILCRRGRIREAAAALEEVRGLPAPGPEQRELRRLEAATFTWMQRYGDALRAYRALFEDGTYDLDDLRGLHDLARDRDPDLAVRAAVAGWGRFRYPEFLVYYLERCIHADRWDLASRALERLTPEHWSLFADVPYFFTLAARIHQHDGKADLARREYRHALALEPASEDFQAGYLWLLMEQGRMADLAVHAERWDRGARNSPILLEPLAMAYKLLHRDRQALAYFRLLDAGENRTDFPFLMVYAGLLQQAGDGQGAARLYLRAAAVLRAPPGPGEDRASREWQEARARWTWMFGGSDETRRRMDALMTSYAGGQGTKELMFSWRVDRGQNPEDAMAALEGPSGGEKAFPAWARLAVALRTHDVGKVADLLESRDATLGPEEKARAAAYLGRRREAAQFASETRGPARTASAFEGSPGRGAVSGLGGGIEAAGHPQYLEHRTALSGQTALSTGTLIRVAAETRRRPWISNRLSVPVADREDAGLIGLEGESRLGTTRLSAGLRSTAAASAGRHADPALVLAAEQEWRLPREAFLTLGYDRNALAEENPILALAGQKDQWKAGLGLALPARTRLDVTGSLSRFHDWDGRRLGEGAILRSEVELHRLRPLIAGARLAYNGFSPAGMRPGPAGEARVAGLLLPNEFPRSFWQASAYIGWSGRAPRVRSWWPSPSASAEIGGNRFPASGTEKSLWTREYALRAGLAFLPAYSQRLVVAGTYAHGLQGRNGAETGLSTRYEYSFE